MRRGIPDILVVEQESQLPLVRLDCLGVPTVQVPPVADEKVWEVPALSCDEHLAPEANGVVYGSHPGRIVLQGLAQD